MKLVTMKIFFLNTSLPSTSNPDQIQDELNKTLAVISSSLTQNESPEHVSDCSD